ncbi:MAG: hypothetical protein C0490_25635, partial [Marivirga sp.]|nr:hypothetical protein [Marivirga sp.]
KLRNLAMKINKKWHLANLMPKNPTIEQRIEWHIEHAKECKCREIPTSILKEINKGEGKK